MCIKARAGVECKRALVGWFVNDEAGGQIAPKAFRLDVCLMKK
jgi:hypothetical protein